MTNKISILAISLLAFGLSIAGADAAQASNAIAEKEGMVCTSCHDKPGSKLLTGKGKYYEHMRSVDGYEELMAGFGACTSCHVRKPGSTKLTAEGKVLRGLGRDMDALLVWLRAQHPVKEQEMPPGDTADDSPAEGKEASDPAPKR